MEKSEQKKMKIEKIVENYIDERLQKFMDEIKNNDINQQSEDIGEIINDLKNENGNSTVKQSGNGIVYVDNTGIAYALVLFYHQIMSQHYKQTVNIDEILNRLDGLINGNRQVFVDLVNELKPNDDKEK